MGIELHFETNFVLGEAQKYTEWIKKVIVSADRELGALNYVFCSDAYLLDMNRDFLKHDYLTDVITFDTSDGTPISGDIFISVDRVRENAMTFGESFERELARVMVHGLLHLFGFRDKSDEEMRQMRTEEDRYLELFHVKQ